MINKEDLRWIRNQYRGTGWTVLFLIMAVIINVIGTLSIAYILKLFVDVATGDTFLHVKDVVVIAVAVLMIGGASDVLCSYLDAKVRAKTEFKMRKDVLGFLLNGRYEKTEKIHSEEIMTKLTQDVTDVSSLLPDIIVHLCGSVFIAMFATAALFLLNAKIALAVVVVVPILISVISMFNFPIAKVDSKLKASEEKNRIMLQEFVSKSNAIISFRRQNRFLQLYRQNYAELYSHKIRFSIWYGGAMFCNGLVGNAMILITLGFGAYLVIKGETTLGNLVAMVQLLNYIMNPFSKISQEMTKISKAGISAERIRKIIEDVGKENELHSEIKEFKARELEVVHISYSYDDKCALKDVSAKFRVGKIYGIKGDNGSGKSTLLKIIAGFYTAKKGEVTVSDGKGTAIKTEEYGNISLIPANETLFSGTIRDNITLFEEQYDENRLKEIEELTNIGNIAENKEDIYNMFVSENGKSLSSGQIQQVILSRVLYYKTDVILLDEPTANLDSESVTKFGEMLGKIKPDKIIILISHDEAIMKYCDVVYEMNNGTISSPVA